MPFSTLTPKIQATDERWEDFKILESFTYIDRATGKKVTVPVGFVTDFASIPRVVRWRINVIGSMRVLR